MTKKIARVKQLTSTSGSATAFASSNSVMLRYGPWGGGQAVLLATQTREGKWTYRWP